LKGNIEPIGPGVGGEQQPKDQGQGGLTKL